jgi:hypothetical protein
VRAETTNIAEITNICITVSGNTKKQQRTLPVRSTILSTYLIGIVGAGDQTEESCQRVRRWIRDFPHLEQIHKTTYAPMIYTSLYVMLLMRTNPRLGQVGGGLALEISTFLGPKWHSPNGLMPFHRAQKSLNFQGPTPSHSPSKWICTHQKHYIRGHINHRCVNS